MNPGPIEETGETARTAIDALKSSPLLLGTMILQLLTLIILFWVAHERNTYETGVNQIFERLLNSCERKIQDNME